MPEFYTDIVTVQQVHDALLESFPTGKLDDMLVDSTAINRDLIRRVHRATERIERFLDRQLVVRAQTLRFTAGGWVQCEGYNEQDEALRFLSWVRHYPVVEITLVDSAADDVVNIEIVDNGVRVAYDADAVIGDLPFIHMSAFCGYRREDQGVGTPGSGDSFTDDLTLNTDLAALTVTPPLIPQDIVDECIHMIVGPLRIALQGLEGVHRSDIAIGEEQVLTTLPDVKLDMRSLHNIAHHRYDTF